MLHGVYRKAERSWHNFINQIQLITTVCLRYRHILSRLSRSEQEKNPLIRELRCFHLIISFRFQELPLSLHMADVSVPEIMHWLRLQGRVREDGAGQKRMGLVKARK